MVTKRPYKELIKKIEKKCCMINKDDTVFFNNGAWDGATLTANKALGQFGFFLRQDIQRS
jgi:hypothetical protein